MKSRPEVLLKSFGNGVAMLRFQKDQTPSAVAAFVSDLGMPTQEFLIGEHATDVFVMFEEGHPVSEIELRNTEDEWQSLVSTVESQGSEAFRARVSGLEAARRSLSGVAVTS